MKGKLKFVNEELYVEYIDGPFLILDYPLQHIKNPKFEDFPSNIRRLPVYENDIQNFNLKYVSLEYVETAIVEFTIVTEFTHPDLFRNVSWGDGITYAKITKVN